jgi:hypothetical protein
MIAGWAAKEDRVLSRGPSGPARASGDRVAAGVSIRALSGQPGASEGEQSEEDQ